MIRKLFKPNARYIYKLRSMLIALALIVLALGVVVAALLSQDRSIAHHATPVLKAVLVLDLVWLLPALSLTKTYYRSLLYEVHEGEIRVSSGIWTKTVSHIPYWAVSGISVKRDMLDRWLEIATLSIQTVSIDGEIGAEKKLVGISDVNEIVGILEGALKSYRNSQKSKSQVHSVVRG